MLFRWIGCVLLVSTMSADMVVYKILQNPCLIKSSAPLTRCVSGSLPILIKLVVVGLVYNLMYKVSETKLIYVMLDTIYYLICAQAHIKKRRLSHKSRFM